MRLRLGCGIAACSRDTSPYRWWRHCPLQCAEEPSLHLWLGHCCCCFCCLRENESFSLGKRERPQRERERALFALSRDSFPSLFFSFDSRVCHTVVCRAHKDTASRTLKQIYIYIYMYISPNAFVFPTPSVLAFFLFLCTRPFPFVYFFFFLSWLPNLCPSSTPLRRLVLLLRCHLSSFTLSLSLSVCQRACVSSDLLRASPSRSTLCSTERALIGAVISRSLKIQQEREKELFKIQQQEREGAIQNPTTRERKMREMSRH